MRTLGPAGAVLSTLIAVTVFGVVGGLYALYFATQVAGSSPGNMTSFLAAHGDAFALAGILGALAGSLALVVVALLTGVRFADQWPMRIDGPRLARWLLAGGAAFVVLIPLTALLGDARGAKVYVEAYRSATAPWLMGVAIALAGPVFEELAVRGLLLPAFARTRLGVRGAVVLTALVWALAHAGRHPAAIATLFAFGLLLGAARASTNSMTTPIAMHVAWNGALVALLATT